MGSAAAVHEYDGRVRPMPAPKKFTRAQLQTVALTLVDEQGLAALTMRNLASALGTGPMTIYNYVDRREGLEQLVTEAVMAEAHWDTTPTDDWTDAVAAVAEGMWRAVRAHPNAVPLILTRRILDAATLTPAEALLEALARSGRSGTGLLVAFRLVSAFITGFAQAEFAPTDQAAALPADQFPHLVAMAHTATASNPEAEFHSALSIILKGLRLDG
ncbi:TetR/AcrR family transcriptional regulator [Kribbella sp. NPDC056951]|uniref:TetR/AcrR family transcriptional regulator n=1 Tax=Kribbella sp. NPDC056951 TaxID=3345978 RepID=UPI0036339A85